MLPFNAHKNSDGFTLIETVVILLIVGILSAIAAPSFLGLLNRGKVNNAVAQVQGALQEAQREAIRRSKKCRVIVPAGSSVTLTSPDNCLVTGDRTLNGINIRTDNSTITFNFRGGTTTASTIVLGHPDGSVSQQKCVVISSGIGIIRSGNYNDGGSTLTTNPAKCQTSP